MKMRSWFDNGLILADKYGRPKITIQNTKLLFEIFPNFNFGYKYFEPSLGVKFNFNWVKDDKTIGVCFYLFLITVYINYYSSGK